MLCNLAVFWSRRGFLFIPPTHSNLMFSSAGLARGEEQLDVVSGSAVTLKCRFDPQLTQKRSTLYWIRSNRINHDNVAIGETAFHQDYRSVYLLYLATYPVSACRAAPGWVANLDYILLLEYCTTFLFSQIYEVWPLNRMP